MTNWYVSLDAVKRAAGIVGSDKDAVIKGLIESVCRELDDETNTWFIPKTDTRYLPFAEPWLRGRILHFDAHLLSVTSFKDQGGDRTLTSGTHFFLQPENAGPPYEWAEILLSQAQTFESDPDTRQRSFVIEGSWGGCQDTVAAGTVATANQTSTSQTTLEVTDGSLIDVGDTVLIESEQEFVTARGDVDIAQNTSGALTADESDTTVTLGGAPTVAVKVGEVLRVGSERMLVEAINSTTSFVVTRAHDGSTLAAHLTNADVFIQRTYTVTRGVNGTTAATHAAAVAIAKYQAPAPIRQLVLATVVERFQSDRSGRTEERGRPWLSALERDRKRVLQAHRRHQMRSF